MKRSIIVLGIAALLIALTPLVPKPHTVTAKTESERIACITQYGWETDGVCTDTVELRIPDPLGEVFEEYNAMQRSAGFNLSNYSGMAVTRYTYRILNHKNARGSDVFCNLMVYDDKMIAADIMTAAVDGFMHGINEKLYIK